MLILADSCACIKIVLVLVLVVVLVLEGAFFTAFPNHPEISFRMALQDFVKPKTFENDDEGRGREIPQRNRRYSLGERPTSRRKIRAKWLGLV